MTIPSTFYEIFPNVFVCTKEEYLSSKVVANHLTVQVWTSLDTFVVNIYAGDIGIIGIVIPMLHERFVTAKEDKLVKLPFIEFMER